MSRFYNALALLAVAALAGPARAAFLNQISMSMDNWDQANNRYVTASYFTPDATASKDQHRLDGLYARAYGLSDSDLGVMRFSCSADLLDEYASGGSASVAIGQEGFVRIRNRGTSLRTQHFSMTVDGSASGSFDGGYKIRVGGDERYSDAAVLGKTQRTLGVDFPLLPGLNVFKIELLLAGSVEGPGVLNYEHTFRFGIPIVDADVAFESQDGFLAGAVTPEPAGLTAAAVAVLALGRRWRARTGARKNPRRLPGASGPE
jgi:hypothetical protein